MSRRPTAKAGTVAAVGVLLVGTATTAQAGWLFVLSAGVLGLVVSGVLTWHRLGAASVTRSLPARARVGEDVSLRVSVHNASGKRLPVLRVEDRFTAFGGFALASESVPGGGTATVELTRTALRRGVFDDSDVVLSTAAPFGLMRTRRTISVASRLVVHPLVIDVSGFPLPETPATTSDEALAAARTGAGEVFAGVRDYRPGDQRRWIHWRTTARTGRLAVREHEDPARSPIVIVVAGFEDDEVGERVASAAASVALYALDAARPVHCVGHGRFGEVVDNATRLQVLDWAAGLEPSDSRAEDAVAAAFRRWGRRCSFVLFETGDGSLRPAIDLAVRRGAAVQIVRPVSEDEEPVETAA
ncbi:MAG TPA: DUF58 domain-containing protein [Actinomycetota bacterium]|nr:DUF58 domain-containing protein [Actinomycetota bacterium]